MDLIQLHAEPKYTLKIPYVCHPLDYGNVDFESYPQSKGWRLEPVPDPGSPLTGTILTRLDGHEATTSEVAGFLQSWLFFGILLETLAMRGVVVDIDMLLIKEHSKSYVSFDALPGLFQVWRQNGEGLPKSLRKAQFRAVERLIITTYAFTAQNFSDMPPFPNVKAPTRAQRSSVGLGIELSIMNLFELIELVNTTDFMGSSTLEEGANFSSSANLLTHMQRLGWCPSEIAIADKYFDNTTMYFASRLKRKSLSLDHEPCSISDCRARNLPKSTYRSKHTDGCTGCSLVGVDEAVLSAYLLDQTGNATLIDLGSFEGDSDLPLVNDNAAYGLGSPYIAISHVWSDGLGNEENNALPKCQLLRIKSYIEKLRLDYNMKSTCVWMDTICVPISRGPAKRQALQSLLKIYKGAEAVLVLDDDLSRTDSNASDEEKLMRILFSGWMRRLWTFEEGLIAQNRLLFQFRGRAIRTPAVFNAAWDLIGKQAYYCFRNLLPESRTEGAATVDKSISLEGNPLWRKVLRAAAGRSTSRMIDECVCLSHVMGLDVSELVSIEDEQERMRHFLSMLGQSGMMLPRNLIFTGEPKLSFDGWRWAPESFLSIGDGLGYNDLSSWSAAGGLQIKTSGCRQLTFERPMRKVAFFKEGVSWYVIAPITERAAHLRSRYWNRHLAATVNDMDLPSSWTERWSSLDSLNPCYLIPESRGTCADLGVIVSGGSYRESSRSADFVVDIVLQVYVYELEADGFNLPVSGINQRSYGLGFTEKTFADLEQAMEVAFHRFYNPDTVSIAIMDLSRAEADVSWIVR